MKCQNKNCEAIVPPHYASCPECGSGLIKEVKAPQTVEVEEVEPITPFVEFTDLADFGS